MKLGVLALILSYSPLYGQHKAALGSLKTPTNPKKSQAWTACPTCPIVWYSTAEELANIKREYYNRNKDVNRWGTKETFDPHSWTWAKKVRFWNMAEIKIRPEWKRVHKAMYPNDKTCL